jgi:triosephosphate isomerase
MVTMFASWAIIGHSERRRDQAETDEQVGRKLLRCGEFGLRPILCVGEQLDEREAGNAEETVRRQLERTFAIIEGAAARAPDDLVIAYEPVWAIGTGKSASAQQAQEVHAFLRERFTQKDASLAGTTLLYGGSVKPANAVELFGQADIDGGLIGGAALVAEDFIAICAAAGA